MCWSWAREVEALLSGQDSKGDGTGIGKSRHGVIQTSWFEASGVEYSMTSDFSKLSVHRK